MNITSWKLVAYDEEDNEIVVDVHRNHVANVIDDFLTESFEEDEWCIRYKWTLSVMDG